MPNLVALPSSRPAAIQHLEHLRALTDETKGDSDDGVCARRRYHARLLGQLLAPGDPESRPLVTVVVPVYNRAALVVEAIESCLRQAWRPLEVLVIDDGSTDELPAALRPYGGQVRLHRKSHGGVSSARNLGIRLAQGDFVHFLDSDDLLMPGAIDRKVAAFLRLADAELCHSEADGVVSAGAHSRALKPSPTRDLVSAVRAGHPFALSTVMMPRWAMLDAPAFEEDLRRAEDTRYWFGLGLRGTKVIALEDRLTARRKVGPSLSDLGRRTHESVTIRARDLRDLLASPRHWRYAAGYYMRLAADSQQCVPYDDAAGTAAGALAELVSMLSSLAGGARREGLSPLPLFAALKVVDRKWGAAARAGHLSDGLDRFFAAVPAAIDAGLRSSAPLEAEDVLYWLDDGSGRECDPYIHEAFRRLRADAESGRSGDRFGLSWVLRKVPLPLDRSDAKRFRRLRRMTRSSRLAAWLTWRRRVAR